MKMLPLTTHSRQIVIPVCGLIFELIKELFAKPLICGGMLRRLEVQILLSQSFLQILRITLLMKQMFGVQLLILLALRAMQTIPDTDVG